MAVLGLAGKSNGGALGSKKKQEGNPMQNSSMKESSAQRAVQYAEAEKVRAEADAIKSAAVI